MAAKSKRGWVILLVAGGLYLLTIIVVMVKPGAVLSTDGRTMIRLVHWQVEAGPREAINALIERYEELNPDVRVVQLAIPGTAYERYVRTQLIGETGPDLIEFGRPNSDIVPRFFEPISTYVAEPNPYNVGTPLEGVRWRDTFIDGLNTPVSYIDRLSNYYSITMCTVTLRLFYNPDLLEEVTGSREPPKTYEELRVIQDQVTAFRGKTGRTLALHAGCTFTGEIMAEWLLSRAGVGLGFALDRYREQGPKGPQMAQEYIRGNWDFRTPALYSALKNTREAAKFMRPGFQQMDRDSATQEFLRGQALMIVTGTWDATSLKTMAPFEVGVDHIPWPAMSDNTETGRYYWSPISDGEASTAMPFYLNKNSAHKKEAMDFMRFATSLEGNTIWMKMSGWNPSIRGVELLPELEIFQHVFKGYMGRTSFMRGFGVETQEIWQRQIHNLTAVNGGVEKFLEAFQKEYPAALRKDLESQARTIYLSVRRDESSLTALKMLDRLVGHDSAKVLARKVRESSQTITEAKLYEMEAVLARGPAVADPLP